MAKKLVLTDFATNQLLQSSSALLGLLEDNDFDNLDADQMSDAMMHLERFSALLLDIARKAGINYAAAPPDKFIKGSVDVIED